MRNHALAILALLFLASPFASAQESSCAPHDAKARQAVNLLRLLNTVENDVKHSRQRYLPLRELVKTAEFERWVQRGGFDLPKLALDAEDLGVGLKIVAVASETGDAYAFFVQSTPADACPFGFYTDRRGLIFKAAPLG